MMLVYYILLPPTQFGRSTNACARSERSTTRRMLCHKKNRLHRPRRMAGFQKSNKMSFCFFLALLSMSIIRANGGGPLLSTREEQELLTIHNYLRSIVNPTATNMQRMVSNLATRSIVAQLNASVVISLCKLHEVFLLFQYILCILLKMYVCAINYCVPCIKSSICTFNSFSKLANQ